MDFNTLNKINVNDKTDKKGNFTYLSWSWAWAEFMKHYPDATYQILDDKVYPDNTMEVRVAVTAGGITHTMWLPVIDFKNKAIANPNAMDINTARMRCLVKCLAMFGLGLYIYAGEDLPDVKPDYKDFQKHKQFYLDKINEGESAQILIERLEEKYEVSESVKNQIKKLGEN